MIRNVICKNCKEEFKIKSYSNSRHELEDERGRYFMAKCDQCHIDNEYHVNEVYANAGKPNLVFLLVGGLLVAVLLFFCLLSFGFIGSITIVVPAFIYVKLKQSAEKSVELFNQSEISRTRPS